MVLMKYFISFFILIFFALQTKAQQLDSAKVEVHLIIGKIIKGTIVEFVPDKFIKIKTAEQNVVLINLDEIEKVKSSEVPLDSTSTSKIKHINNKPFRVKYFNTTEIGIAGIDEGNYLVYFGISNINGVQLSRQSSFGIGLGVSNYGYGLGYPIFLDWITCFAKDKVTPFFRLNVCLIVPDKKGSEASLGGPIFEPSFGIKFGNNGIVSSFNIATGILLLPQVETIYLNNGPTYETPVFKAAVHLRAGFTF